MDLMQILLFVVAGAIIGLIARAILPGRDPMSIPMTILLGIAGAVVGGLIGNAINKDNDGIHWILSILAAVALLLVFRSVGGRSRRGVL